jgi:hypothetical protein
MADEAVETVRRFQVQEFRGIFPDFSEEEATFYLHSANWSVEDAVTMAVTHSSEGRRPPLQQHASAPANNCANAGASSSSSASVGASTSSASAGAGAGARRRQDPAASRQPRGVVGGRGRATTATPTAASSIADDDEADAVRRTEWELRKAMYVEQVHEATGLPRFECQEVLKGVDWNVNVAVAKIMPETLCVRACVRVRAASSRHPVHSSPAAVSSADAAALAATCHLPTQTDRRAELKCARAPSPLIFRARTTTTTTTTDDDFCCCCCWPPRNHHARLTARDDDAC